MNYERQHLDADDDDTIPITVKELREIGFAVGNRGIARTLDFIGNSVSPSVQQTIKKRMRMLIEDMIERIVNGEWQGEE